MHAETSNSPKQRYEDWLQTGQVTPDAAQERIVGELDSLYRNLLSRRDKHGLLSFFHRDADMPKGLYIWGGVGRGKSMLMDMFYATLPSHVSKRREHFHQFMTKIHDALHHRRLSHPKEPEPLLAVIDAYADGLDVLCLDEFQVHDITTAMILTRLFERLMEKPIAIVTTSNRPPDDLYLNGLQRQAFLPCIALLKSRLHVLELASETDYRLQKMSAAETYITPLSPESTAKLEAIFTSLTMQAPEAHTLRIKGRDLTVDLAANGVALTGFASLCREARGNEDFEALARTYHTVMVHDIPQMAREERNEAKRFVTLIDILYDHRVKFICTAAVKPEELYPAGDGNFEFQRTVSRLHEMQSDDYLAASHHS